MVESLVQNGCDVTQPDEQGVCPLVWAIKQCSLTQIQMLLDRGADPNQISISGRSLLVQALSQGSTAIAELLMAYGCNVSMPDDHGYTPLT